MGGPGPLLARGWVLLVIAVVCSSAQTLEVKYGETDASFTASVNGDVLVQSGTHEGEDILGPYNQAVWRMTANFGSSSVNGTLDIRTYTDMPAAILTQSYEDGFDTCEGDWSTPSTAYPTFATNGSSAGFINWNGQGDVYWGKLEEYSGGQLRGLPIVVVPPSKDRALAIAPITRFLSTVFAKDNTTKDIVIGVQGAAKTVPEGYSSSVIIQAGTTVNSAMLSIGDNLLRYYSKQRTPPQANVHVGRLGYSTVGHYFYGIEKTEGNGTYADTLVSVFDNARSLGLPYSYVLIDSWWYGENSQCSYPKKEGGCDPGFGGVWRWDDEVSRNQYVFPSGLKSLRSQLGVDFVMHMGMWVGTDVKSGPPPYATNRSFEWVVEPKASLSVAEKFWDWLFSEMDANGLKVFKLDHTQQQVPNMACTSDSVDIVDAWLTTQANMALKYGIHKQYGGAGPAMFMHSVTLPGATHARVGPDYIPRIKRPSNACNVPQSTEVASSLYNAAISRNSLLHWSVGLRPYKDAFFSGHQRWENTSCYNMGTYTYPEWYGLQEQSSELHALVSALTAGPIAPCDGVRDANASLVMMTCRTDGVLLKPDRPALPLAKLWMDLPFSQSSTAPAEVSFTYTAYTSDLRWTFLLAFAVTSSYSVSYDDLEYGNPVDCIAWSFRDRSAHLFNKTSQPIVVPKSGEWFDYQYITFAPIMSINGQNFAIIGEAAKFITMSKQRIRNILPEADKVGIELTGAPNEKVTLDWWAEDRVHECNCTLSSGGTGWMYLPACTCSA